MLNKIFTWNQHTAVAGIFPLIQLKCRMNQSITAFENGNMRFRWSVGRHRRQPTPMHLVRFLFHTINYNFDLREPNAARDNDISLRLTVEHVFGNKMKREKNCVCVNHGSIKWNSCGLFYAIVTIADTIMSIVDRDAPFYVVAVIRFRWRCYTNGIQTKGKVILLMSFEEEK